MRRRQTPFSPLPLPLGEVHVWRADLHQRGDCLAEVTKTLSSDERDQAARFRLPRDGDSFVLRRGVLRAILGLYLSVGPGEVRFSYGPHRKPALDRNYHGQSLSFNVAHRRGIALYAVTGRDAVGVDIEYVEPLPDLEGLASTFLSTRELSLLHLLPEGERLVGFFTCWTRKEAYLKALGEGLMRPANQVEVYLDLSGTTELHEIDARKGENRVWRIETMVPAPGYLGAVAVEGVDWLTRWLDWPPEQ